MSTTLDLLNSANALLSSCEGLPPEEMDAKIAEWLGNASDKAAALQAVVTRAENQKTFYTKEAQSLTVAATQQEAIAVRCRAMIVGILRKQSELGEGTSIKGAGWSMSLRESTAVDVSDLDALPPRYWRERTSREPDKAAIKADIESGVVVPGASLKLNHSVTIRKAGGKDSV